MARWSNWSGWVKSDPDVIAQPDSEEALSDVMASSTGPVRVVGTGHSFTPLAATNGTLIELSKLTGLVGVDKAKMEATVWAGTPIHELTRALYAEGLALINQGDIDRQTIAGAVSTGTHGTGPELQNFSAMVRALRLVTPSGEVIAAAPHSNADVFEAGRLSLGALGVISQLTLAVQPAYKLNEQGWTMPASMCLEQAADLSRATRHFEFFWFPYADKVICKSLDMTELDAPEPRSDDRQKGDALDAEEKLVRRMFDLTAFAPFLSGPVTRLMTRMAGSDQMQRHAKTGGRTRWSHEAFPSARNLKFNEMEWALPAETGLDALREIVGYVRQKSERVAFPIECRWVAGDDVWLSPFNGRDSITIAVHQYHKQDYRHFFDACEQVFRNHNGRPHWGKLHRCTAPDFAEAYPKWAAFNDVRARLDPTGRMLNEHLATVFGAAAV